MSLDGHSSGSPKPEVSAILGKLDEIGSELMTAQEWGIFGKEAGNPQEKEIIDKLEKGRKTAEAGDIPGAQTALLQAKSTLSRAQRGWSWWSLNNRYGIGPLVCTAFGACIAYCGIGAGKALSVEHASAGHAAYLGLTGATLRTLYWLQHQINRGQLRPRWMAYFLVAPSVGALLGAFSYLIVLVSSKLAGEGPALKVDETTIGLFAAFAGYNWEWALEKFLVAANALAARSPSKAAK